VDESGKVPENVWTEATAMWGASIENDLFAGKKKSGDSMRTKLAPSGGVHKESLDAAQLGTLISEQVTNALNSHPALQETETARQRRVLKEQTLACVGADSAHRDMVVESVLQMFDAGQRFTEAQLRGIVGAQEKAFAAIKAMQVPTMPNVTRTSGQLGSQVAEAATQLKPAVNEYDSSMQAMFG
jgi:hypothetical protein